MDSPGGTAVILIECSNTINSSHLFQNRFDVTEAARQCRVSTPTVRQLVAAEEITHYRVGYEIRIRREDLDAYLDRTRIPTQCPDGRPVP